MGEVERGQRRLLGRLEDGGAAGGEDGPDLPERHDEREVPRDDLAADADGLLPRVGEAGTVGGDGEAVNLVGLPGVVAEELEAGGHVSPSWKEVKKCELEFTQPYEDE